MSNMHCAGSCVGQRFPTSVPRNF